MSCEKTDNTVIDPTLTFPAITSAFVNPASMNSITINTVAVAVITSDEQIASVKAAVTDPLGTEIMTIDLKDDGVLPDTTAGDNHYSGLINRNPDCRVVGTFKVQFLAQNISGLSSNSYIVNFSVINSNNHPPVLSNINITPDSAQIGLFTFLNFLITATDSDGQCDIRRVYYTGFKPNNSPLTPQDLFDDGSCCPINGGAVSGDTTANNTIYTRILYGPPDQLGYFRYFIHAIDGSGDTSNVLSDSIYIHP